MRIMNMIIEPLIFLLSGNGSSPIVFFFPLIDRTATEIDCNKAWRSYPTPFKIFRPCNEIDRRDIRTSQRYSGSRSDYRKKKGKRLISPPEVSYSNSSTRYFTLVLIPHVLNLKTYIPTLRKLETYLHMIFKF